jgi:UDP-glucuronate 4-epimerase
MKVLVTGSAGFIGFHVARRLLEEGHQVLGYDALTPYYDPALKRKRQQILTEYAGFATHEAMLEDRDRVFQAVGNFEPEIIIHLAAQAGVRYSIEKPGQYIDSNITGTFNLLEAARANKPRHLLLASTSSVYGGNEKQPFSESDKTDNPVSLYAATKKATETLSHSYAHLFDIPTTCCRFFTVYGPWGRPDMALFKFVDAIEHGTPIDIYGEGRMQRDFTFVDDVVEALLRLVDIVPERSKPVTGGPVADSLSLVAPWRVVNIAGGQPVGLMNFVSTIEQSLGQDAIKRMLPHQQGDMAQTIADTRLLHMLTGFLPQVPVARGVASFVAWYNDYRRSLPA